MFGSCRCVLPDPAVGCHAQKLITARPRNRPAAVSFGELDHDCMRRIAQARFTAVRVDEEVRRQRSPGAGIAVDQLTQFRPGNTVQADRPLPDCQPSDRTGCTGAEAARTRAHGGARPRPRRATVALFPGRDASLSQGAHHGYRWLSSCPHTNHTVRYGEAIQSVVGGGAVAVAGMPSGQTPIRIATR